MDPKTILWPTDLSSESIASAPKVMALSQKYNAAVVMLYVAVDLCSYFPAYGNFPSNEVVDNFRLWEIKHARALMEDVCEKDLKACPHLELELVNGDPVEEIFKMAAKKNADLIVMTASHGRHSKEGPGLGHVAEAVVARGVLPVLFVSP
ncbi:MAG: universal stress protein [Desulfovibrio sp.]|nr:universal stress protein [Desulfovibrio sp.]MCA1985970.1 universal stress protein [Desulfovibrio sp.]